MVLLDPASREAAPAVSLGLAPFGRKLLPRVREIAQAISNRVFAEIPAYASLSDQAVRVQVREAAGRNVAAFLEALGEGKELSRQEIEALAVVGEERAYQGIPLEDLLRAFRMVGRVLWEYFGKQLTLVPEPSMDQLVELGAALMRFTDQLSSSVAQRYSETLGAIVRRQEASRREFLQDLLLGGQSSDDSIIQRARGFGYDPVRGQFAIAAISESAIPDAGRDELELTKALDQIAEKVGAEGRAMVGTRGDQTIGLFAVSVPSRPSLRGTSSVSVRGAETSVTAHEVGALLLSELQDGWKIGIGGPYAGLEGCRRSYLEAREALEIGRLVDPDRRIYPFEDYLLYLFLRADKALAERFVSTVLGPVIQHDRKRRSDLLSTLESYFANAESAKETGRTLYAHPHTITYRMKQIEKLTGCSLKDPQDKLHLQLAVKAYRILNPSRS